MQAFLLGFIWIYLDGARAVVESIYPAPDDRRLKPRLARYAFADPGVFHSRPRMIDSWT
jgi:hypothetical protein